MGTPDEAWGCFRLSELAEAWSRHLVDGAQEAAIQPAAPMAGPPGAEIEKFCLRGSNADLRIISSPPVF